MPVFAEPDAEKLRVYIENLERKNGMLSESINRLGRGQEERGEKGGESELDPRGALAVLNDAMGQDEALLDMALVDMPVGDRNVLLELNQAYEALVNSRLRFASHSLESWAHSDGKFVASMAVMNHLHAKASAATAILFDATQYLSGRRAKIISEGAFEAVGVELIVAWATAAAMKTNLMMSISLEALNTQVPMNEMHDALTSMLREDEQAKAFSRTQWAGRLKKSQTLLKQLGQSGQAPFQRSSHPQGQGGGGGYQQGFGGGRGGHNNNNNNNSTYRSRGGHNARGKQ